MNKVFVGQHEEILKAFMESEAKSYQKNVKKNTFNPKDYSTWELNEKGKKYIESLLIKVEEEIKWQVPDGFNYAIFNSITNLGLLNCSIKISPSNDFWNFQGGDISINLCPCGNINHWGNLNVLEKKNKNLWKRENEKRS